MNEEINHYHNTYCTGRPSELRNQVTGVVSFTHLFKNLFMNGEKKLLNSKDVTENKIKYSKYVIDFESFNLFNGLFEIP